MGMRHDPESDRRLGRSAHMVRVGPYTFDQRTLELFEGDRPVRLAPKPTLVLAELVSRRGALVRRERLYEIAWGDTVVEFDLALNRCIKEIRAAVGDHARAPWFIETVPRRGYRLIAPVEPLRPVAGRGRWHGRTTRALTAAVLVLASIGLLMPRGRSTNDAATILSFQSFGAEQENLDQAIQAAVRRRLALDSGTPRSKGLLVSGVIVPATDGALLEVTFVRLADGETIWRGRYNPLCDRIVGDPTEVIGGLISREVLRRS